MKRLMLCVFLLSAGSTLAEERVLHIYNWADYLSDEVIQLFKKETGIEIKQDYFGSNEELIAKLQTGAFDYDIAVPSDYYVKLLVAHHLLAPLDFTQIPNRKNLEDRFLNPSYDSNNQHSIPYFWGTTGIAYDANRIKTPITSWNSLFDPKWKRKINFLDDMREVIGAVLRIQGASVNTRDKNALESARKFLLSAKDVIRTFNSSTYKESLDAGDIWISQGFSVDIIRLTDEKPNIRYVIPEDGATLYTDNLVIPATSKRVKDAHTFINFILRPDIGAKLALSIRAATPNKEAFKLLPDEVKKNPGSYPSVDLIKKFEYIEDVGEALETYESIWFDLKTH